jgi:nitrate reductase NapAB chaperone NapD
LRAPGYFSHIEQSSTIRAAAGRRTRMNISGILVVADTDHIDTVLAQLAALDGFEIAQCDRAGGRIVVVQEAPHVGAEVAGFSRIRALPHVLSADLVCHYFGDEPLAEPHSESVLASLTMPAPAAPQPPDDAP